MKASKYTYVSRQKQSRTNKPIWVARIPGGKQKEFEYTPEGERSAAKHVDLLLIRAGKEPVNGTLKPV